MTTEKVSLKSKFKSLSKAKKIIALILLLIALLTLYRIGLAIIGPDEEPELPVYVETALAEMGSIYTTSPLSGRIMPKDEAYILALAQGRVAAVNVSLGDYVEEGTVLFEVDSGLVGAAYSQASSAYQAAKTAYNAMALLYKEGAVSRADYEGAKAQHDGALAAFTQAKEAYDNSKPTAPFSGYITALNVTVGNQAPTGQVAATVADISSFIIEGGISEYLAGYVSKGQEVDVVVASLPNRVFTGIVDSVSPAPSYQTLTYPIKITISDETNTLKAGMFAEIRIRNDEKTDVLLVPSDAPYLQKGKTYIITLDDNSLPIFNEVSTGIDNGQMVEVLSGIKAGDMVVTAGQPYVTEGIPVVVSGQQETNSKI